MSWEGEKNRERESIKREKEGQAAIGISIYKILLLGMITFGQGLMRLLYQMN